MTLEELIAYEQQRGNPRWLLLLLIAIDGVRVTLPWEKLMREYVPLWERN